MKAWTSACEAADREPFTLAASYVHRTVEPILGAANLPKKTNDDIVSALTISTYISDLCMLVLDNRGRMEVGDGMIVMLSTLSAELLFEIPLTRA